MFDIIGKRYWYFLISALLIIPGLIAMAYSTVTYGAPVRLSIDFTGRVPESLNPGANYFICAFLDAVEAGFHNFKGIISRFLLAQKSRREMGWIEHGADDIHMGGNGLNQLPDAEILRLPGHQPE